MVRRHTPRQDVHIVQSMEGKVLSDECEDGPNPEDHDQCDGYIRVMGYRPYCECGCHVLDQEDI